MGTNYYRDINKVKAFLEKSGHSKDIHIETFAKAMAIVFGMKRNTAGKWIKNYIDMNFIEMKDRKINFNNL